MLFWRKNKAQEVREDLDKLANKIKKLEKFEEKKDKTHAIVKKIMHTADETKKDILGMAEEQKSIIWIDSQYDGEIDRLAAQEIEALKKLEKDISDYDEYLGVAKSHEDIDEVIRNLEQFANILSERERQSEQRIEKMENDSLTRRLNIKSDRPPALRTNDGYRWSDICNVARKLGGWVELNRGTHVAEIKFPNAARPIPISADVGSGRISAQIIDQLKRFLPRHKIPNQHNLRNAIRTGDIHHIR
jgi:hypothetical protein